MGLIGAKDMFDLGIDHGVRGVAHKSPVPLGNFISCLICSMVRISPTPIPGFDDPRPIPVDRLGAFRDKSFSLRILAQLTKLEQI